MQKSSMGMRDFWGNTMQQEKRSELEVWTPQNPMPFIF